MQLAEAVVRATSGTLSKRVRERLHESDLPIRLKLWNGEEIGSSASPKAEVIVRKPHALLAFARLQSDSRPVATPEIAFPAITQEINPVRKLRRLRETER